MSTHRPGKPDPEDLFSDTRMTFGEHIEELRWHLWRAIVGFLIATVLCFFISPTVLKAIIINPVEEKLQKYYDKKQEAEIAKIRNDPEKNRPRVVPLTFSRDQLAALIQGRDVPFEPADPPKEIPEDGRVSLWVQMDRPVDWVLEVMGDVAKRLGPRPSVKAFSILEAFTVYLKVSMACGLLLAAPWVFYQIWAFIAAGLYPHEKRYINVYLPISIILFLLGALLCQFVVLPAAIDALLWFNDLINVDPDLRLNEWLGFAILLPVVFGISFQTPLVMLFLERIGVMTVDGYRAKRRIAYFAMAVVSAIGPTIDAVSMLVQWVALLGLYEFGILLCLWAPKHESPFDDEDVTADEMVEV